MPQWKIASLQRYAKTEGKKTMELQYSQKVINKNGISTILPAMDRSSRQKIGKEILDLNHSLDQ